MTKLLLLSFKFYSEIKSVLYILINPRNSVALYLIFHRPLYFVCLDCLVTVGQSSRDGRLECLCILGCGSFPLKDGLAGWYVLGCIPPARSLCSPSYVCITMLLLEAPLRSHRAASLLLLSRYLCDLWNGGSIVCHFHSLSFTLKQLVKLLEFWCVFSHHISSFSTIISY